MGVSEANAAEKKRFTSFRFTLVPTEAQAACYRRHDGASRFAYNRVVELYIRAKQVKAADPSGRPDLWVPTTGLQCIDAFNKWKKVPASETTAAQDPSPPVDPVAQVEACLRRRTDEEKAADKQVPKTFRHPWMAELYQQVLEEGAKDAGAALTARKKWFDGDRKGRCPGRARFKKKGRARSSFRVRNKGGAVVRFRPKGAEGDGGLPHRAVGLPAALGGPVRVRECTRRVRRLLAKPETVLRFATLSLDDARWVLTINVETGALHEAERVQDDASMTPIGIDRGLSTFAVLATADGAEVERITHPRPLKNGLPRLRRHSRAVARKTKGSANQRKARRRQQRHHARIRRRREDFLRRLVSRLAKSHGCWVLETLATKALMRTRRRGLARALADVAWGSFATRLTAKVAQHGGLVIQAPRNFPSTRRCSRCGVVGEPLALSERGFHCSHCGFEADRDTNAAVNLAQFPALPLPTSEKPSG